jgi:uncharacterized phosphosugar-binding protein
VVNADAGFGPSDRLILANAYGIYAALIDTALEAKGTGATLIGIGSWQDGERTAPGHAARPSKANLNDLVDFAVDTKVSVGRAVIRIDGVSEPVWAVSTFTNAYALNAMMLCAVELLADSGVEPPLCRSAYAVGGDESNGRLLASFRDRVRRP